MGVNRFLAHHFDDFIDFDGKLSSKEIAAIAAEPRITRIQTAKPIRKPMLERLNEQLFAQRPDIEFRCYMFFDQVCDLRMLESLPNLRHFSADEIRGELRNPEAVSALPQLESFGIGAFFLTDFGFLSKVPSGIRSLAIHHTKSKKPSIELISRFNQLKALYIEGHNKGIHAVSMLHKLEDLTLRSVSTPNLEYLGGLDNLRSVDLKLGGITNLDTLARLPELRYLELWQIRGLEDISIISKCIGLQFLFLQSLARIKRIPNLRGLTRLRRIHLEHLHTIEDFSALEHAPALEEALLIDAKPAQSELIEPLLRNTSLKRLLVGFGSVKHNAEIERQMQSRGITVYKHTPFVFEP